MVRMDLSSLDYWGHPGAAGGVVSGFAALGRTFKLWAVSSSQPCSPCPALHTASAASSALSPGHSQAAGTPLPMDQTLAALPSPSTGQPGKDLPGETPRVCSACVWARWAQELTR